MQTGFAPSVQRAEALVLAGLVRVDGQVVKSPALCVKPEQVIEVASGKERVGRAGLKLERAFESFPLQAAGKVCVDVGAAVGGFTEVLLAQGASRVYAVDVAYGELAWKLRRDPRVVVVERTNARYLERLPEPAALVSIDVSFISLGLILPNVRKWLAWEGQPPQGDVVALVKPQFEAPRDLVGKGGIVRSRNTHQLVLRRVFEMAQRNGLEPLGLVRSPITGAAGNSEFLVWLGADRRGDFMLEEAIAAATK